MIPTGVVTNGSGGKRESLAGTLRNRLDIAADRRLARRIADGDPAALQAFYDRYADLLHAYIAHRVGEGTADVWQDAMLSALESMSRYEGGSRLFTWLCGIANHRFPVCIVIVRGIRRSRSPICPP